MEEATRASGLMGSRMGKVFIRAVKEIKKLGSGRKGEGLIGLIAKMIMVLQSRRPHNDGIMMFILNTTELF